MEKRTEIQFKKLKYGQAFYYIRAGVKTTGIKQWGDYACIDGKLELMNPNCLVRILKS